LTVPRVHRTLATRFGADEAAVHAWAQHFNRAGAEALEGHLAREAETGRFCHGDTPGMADICLFSLKVGADMFGVNLSDLPSVARICAAREEIPAFAEAHLLRQAGAAHRGS
jgi:glutathione S-transferase